MRLLVSSVVFALTACSLTPSASSRTVQGHVAGLTVDQAIVVAETLDSTQTIAAISKSGGFRLNLPVNQAVRLSVALPLPNGRFVRTSHIGPQWFTLTAGATLDLGEVTVGTAAVTVASTEPIEHQCPIIADGGSREDDGKGNHDEHKDGYEGDDDATRDGGSSSGDHDGHGDDQPRVDAGRGADGHSEVGDDDHRESDEVECGRVEVEGCSTARARCDHDDDLAPATGRVDACTDGTAPDAGATTSPSDAGPTLG